MHKNKKRWPDSERKRKLVTEIARLDKDGLTEEEIAARLGVTSDSVRYLLGRLISGPGVAV